MLDIFKRRFDSNSFLSEPFDYNKLIINKTNYKINTSIEEGIKKFINWYKEYYKL